MDKLKSILDKIPEEERQQLTQLLAKQQKAIALHQELIKQLNQEMALNKVVLNAMEEGIVAVDENHQIIDLNPAFATMFGYTEKELKGRRLNLLLPGVTLENHQESLQEPGEQPQTPVAEDSRDNKLYGVHKSNGAFKVSIAISQGEKSGQKIYTGIVRGLTYEDQLERENEKQTGKLINRARELEGLYNLRILREEDSIAAIFEKLFTKFIPRTTRYPQKAVVIAEHNGQTYRSGDADPIVSLTSKLHNGRITFGFTEDLGYGTDQHQKLLDTFAAELNQAILQVTAKRREHRSELPGTSPELNMDIAHSVNNGLQVIQGHAQTALGMAITDEIKAPLDSIKKMTQELGASVRKIVNSERSDSSTHQDAPGTVHGEIRSSKSQSGHGATTRPDVPNKQHREDQEQQRLNILWAEDDYIIQEVIKEMTKAFDDQIDFVENGKIAMDALQKKNYDVLITDIGMPVMGGWKLLKSIEGLYENMPRVLASGYVINSDDMYSSGASYILNKPVQEDDLADMLSSIKESRLTDDERWSRLFGERYNPIL